MSLLQTHFNALKKKGKKAFIPYIMAGDPSPTATLGLLHALADHGADVIELGFPFSDPTADGPVIQRAADRALQAGMNLKQTLAICAEFRQKNQHTPLVLMGYANPVMRMGYEAFAQAAQKAGIDGVIIVDIPPEEEQEIIPYLQEANIDFIRLLAPTTRGERLPRILKHASGFVYAISIKGITGTHSANLDELAERIVEIQQHTELPIVAGFGIRDAHQAHAFASICDGVVIGSALVEHIQKASQNQENIYEAAGKWMSEISSI